MKRILLSIAATVLVAESTFAADIPLKAPPPVVYDWSGFYIGGGIGTRSGVIDSSVTSATQGTPPVAVNTPALCAFVITGCPNGASYDRTAFRGTLYGGWNWQWSSQWVVGVEGEWGFASGTRSSIGSPYPNLFTLSPNGNPLGLTAGDSFAVKTTWDASARLRAGYLFNPALLLYATGGAAWLHVETISTCSTLNGGTAGANVTCGPGQYLGGLTLAPSAISQSSDRLGWTIGGGLEGKLAPHWIVRGEYRYSSYGTFSATDTRTTTTASPANSPLVVNYSTRVQTHTTTFGVSYLFGGGPVVARY
jgi:outer membrane immunogenic protein